MHMKSLKLLSICLVENELLYSPVKLFQWAGPRRWPTLAEVKLGGESEPLESES